MKPESYLLPRICIALAVLLFLPTRASTVDCAPPEPGTCNLLKTAEVIFVGTAITATTGDTNTRFRVTEQFKGKKTDEIEVVEFPDTLHFRANDSYLVFAVPCPWQGAPKSCLTPWVCSNTRDLMWAAPMLKQLRAEVSGKPVASIYGMLWNVAPPKPPSDYGAPDGPVPNVVLTLQSGRKSIKAQTGDDGLFSFDHVPAGTYKISADNLPAGMTLVGDTILTEPPEPIELPRHSCFNLDLFAVQTNTIKPRRRPN
jgi:hypothetical protein